MKRSFLTPLCCCLATLVGVAALSPHVLGAPNKAANVPAGAAVKAAPQEPVIPLSIFEAPKTPKDGRDPFFPNSSHPYGMVAAKTNTAPPTVNLSLKALSGSPNNRLATINNVTFGVGEENEVMVGTSRVSVRVLEIHVDSVVIEAGGARRTLRMRAGF